MHIPFPLYTTFREEPENVERKVPVNDQHPQESPFVNAYNIKLRELI